MQEFKAWVWERIRQSFALLFSWQSVLFILWPLTSFNILNFVLFSFLEVITFGSKLQEYEGASWLDNTNLANILGDSGLIIYTTIYIILIMVSSFFVICIQLWTIKSIREIIWGHPINPQQSVIYWVQHFWKSLYTYYMYFLYVFMIPALIFILWGMVFIFAIQNGWIGSWFFKTSLTLTFWWVIIWLWISFYRSIKATFFIVNAIDKESFTNENFYSAVKITEGNWARIFWNFVLLWILIWLWSSIIHGIITLLLPIWWENNWGNIISTLSDSKNLQNPEILKHILQSFNQPSFSSTKVIAWILWQIIDSFSLGISLIFTYIFFKRLEFEKYEEQNKKTPREEVL